MTSLKIAISLPEEQVAEVRRAVAEGRARSVSSYISEAIAARAKRDVLHDYVDSLIRDFGAPTAGDYAWAEEQLRRTQTPAQ